MFRLEHSAQCSSWNILYIQCPDRISAARGATPGLLRESSSPLLVVEVGQTQPQLGVIRRQLHSFLLKTHSARYISQLIPGLGAAGRNHRIEARAQRFSFVAKRTRCLCLVEGVERLLWFVYLQVSLAKQH